MRKVRVYIDGFNLYHAIDKIEDNRLKWINFRTLATSFLRPEEELTGVAMFTAIWPYDHAKQLRHKNFLAAQRYFGVAIHEGNFIKPNKYCSTHNRYCGIREEKQTDVGMAVEITKDALTGQVDRVVIVTADSDQIPTARLIQTLPDVQMTLYTPPGRLQEARDLGNFILDRHEITVGRLLTCRLPRNIIDDAGRTIATCPAIYEIDFTS